MKKVSAVTATLALLCLGSFAQANITIETVSVGDAGNAADTTGYGAVSYDYNIGKYEVTANQYAAFLNAKARTDTYSLYNIGMAGTIYGSGITRSGASGSYTYSASSDFVNRPIDYVSFWDACRFTNWLGNGQGTGDTENGAYTLTAGSMANNSVTRNPGWAWAVTSEDEWYKAAHYKGGSANAGYWLYPTGSNTAPGNDMADSSGNNANVKGTPYPIIPGKNITVVGEFQNSESPYGTFDQGGNIWEWNEAVLGGTTKRGMRGGAYYYDSTYVKASYRYNGYVPTIENYVTGFRVSQVAPVSEPSSFIALGALVAPLLAFRRRVGK